MTEVIIFCGGKGTRLWPYTKNKNKNLIEIGGKPILWHVMKTFSSSGFIDFILCLGLHGDKIREYFSIPANRENWKIRFVDTGVETFVGGRLKQVIKLIKSDNFLATYGDGVSNVNIKKLMEFHTKHGKIATLTATKMISPYGILDIAKDGFTIKNFQEKPILNKWINGGFFVFNKKILNYLEESEDLENVILKKLAENNQLIAYKHEDFWKSMDTFKDALILNEMWNSDAPWAIWKKST